MNEQSSCTTCKVEEEDLYCCSFCRRSCYCSEQCHSEDAVHHQAVCVPPPSLSHVLDVVRTAHFDNKWEPIIGYQWRMQDLFHVVQEHHGLRAAWDVLRVFIDAHMSGYHSTGDEDHLVWFRRLTERSIKICNTLQQFRTQAETMCSLGHVLRVVGEFDDARMMYLEAGRIAEHHGFLSVESAVCLGLGLMHMESGDEEYGVKLLRNAVLAIDFSVEPSTSHVLKSLESLSVSLFKTGDTDGLETVVLRLHHEAEEAMLASPSAYFVFYLRSTVLCAQLCQVPSLLTPGKYQHPSTTTLMQDRVDQL